MLYAYAQERGIAHQRCGKLIVATDETQIPQLHAIQAKAAANGVHDLQWLDANQSKALEPQLACVAALLSPSTGIVDSHAYMLALQGEIEAAGGAVAGIRPPASPPCAVPGPDAAARGRPRIARSLPAGNGSQVRVSAGDKA